MPDSSAVAPLESQAGASLSPRSVQEQIDRYQRLRDDFEGTSNAFADTTERPIEEENSGEVNDTDGREEDAEEDATDQEQEQEAEAGAEEVEKPEEADEEGAAEDSSGDEPAGDQDESDGDDRYVEVDEESGTFGVVINGEKVTLDPDELIEQLEAKHKLESDIKRYEEMNKASNERYREAKATRKENEALKARIAELEEASNKSALESIEFPELPIPPSDSLRFDDESAYDEAMRKYREEDLPAYRKALVEATDRRLEAQLKMRESSASRSVQKDQEDGSGEQAGDPEVNSWWEDHEDVRADTDMHNKVANRAYELWETGKYNDKAAVLEIALLDISAKKQAADAAKESARIEAVRKSERRNNQMRIKRAKKPGAPKNATATAGGAQPRGTKRADNAPSRAVRQAEIAEIIKNGGALEEYIAGTV